MATKFDWKLAALFFGALAVLFALGWLTLTPKSVSEQQEVTSSGTVCPSGGTVDIPFYAQYSLADPSTKTTESPEGVKTGIASTFNIYMKGANTKYATAISTATASGSSDPDLACGYEGAFVIVNSTTGFHPQRFDLLKLPYRTPADQVVRDLDAISTITLYGYNSSVSTQTATPLKQTLAASTILQNLKIEVVSQSQKKIVKPMLGFKWVQDVTTDASANSTVTIAADGWSIAQCGLGGTGFDGYDDCFVYNGNVENGKSLFVQPEITSASAFGMINATVQVVDIGEYVDTAGTLLHTGYSNPSTGARPTYSATAATYAIQFNQ